MRTCIALLSVTLLGCSVDPVAPSTDGATTLDAGMDARTDAGPADVVAMDTTPIDTGVDTGVDVAPDLACPTGQTRCGGECVSTGSDARNCGACGNACCAGSICLSGRCSLGCPAGLSPCTPTGSTCPICADFATNNSHCGRCNNACAAGSTCTAGTCGAAFVPLAPCNAASDYVTGSTVTFGGAAGLAYAPRCVTVRAGSVLTFSGSFGGHPLAPSTRGSSMNPIPSTSTGTALDVSFTRTGFYPYYCAFHGTDSGGGMAGVVQVIP